MKGRIGLITVLTDNVPALLQFYRDILGFQAKGEVGEYMEFESEGVRFAVCSRSIMEQATGHASYKEARGGQSFELAFRVDSPEEVDRAYADIAAKGATSVKGPATMPWGLRTAFFADPDGNIHELYADKQGAAKQGSSPAWMDHRRVT